MRYIIYTIFFILLSQLATAQLPANTFRSRIFTGNTEAQWTILDSPLVNPILDTFYARYPGTQIIRIQGSDTAFWFYAGNRIWKRLGNFDSTSLSNRINLKLNISDTVGKWLAQSTRLVDTIYRVNDSTIGYTIKGSARTFQILGRTPSGGGAGTVTSIGLSMPAAFSVTPSTITTSGTFNVSAAGTSSQYIRGNGTLATMDTSAIANFYLKVRSELSGTSPINYNTTTGAISINNATSTGTKGAASFTSSFSDNGAGQIDLATLVSAGSCAGCTLNIDAKGRVISYADGSGGATNNVNIGAGFRPVNTITQEMRTLFAGFGTAIDSVSNSNGLTWRVDSNIIATRYWTVRGFYKSCELTGVDTTGTTDVSASLQSLIDVGCKYIHIPHGTYLLTSTVQLKDSVTIAGDSRGTVIKLTRNKPGFHTSSTAGQWTTFRDFTIQGTYTDSILQDGIRLDTCRGAYVTNVFFFKTAGFGLHTFKDKVSTEANTMFACYADSCHGGVFADIAEFNKISNCIFAYCDTNVKINAGNVTVTDCNITKGSIGVYLSGHAAVPPGDFNDGHTEMTNNIIAHNFFAGLYVDGVTNGMQFGNNIIRNNTGYDVYAQNSDNLWFNDNDLGVDSLVFVNCTNTNLLPTNKIWNVGTGRPGPPDQFLKWRIVGQAPTIIGTGYVQNGISLYDVINNKRFDITHTNNVVDFTTTAQGRIRLNDSTVVGAVISGSEVPNGTITILGNDSEPFKSKILLCTKSVYIDSATTNKDQMLGIGVNAYRGYLLDLQTKRRGIAWIHSENDSSTTLSGAGIRFNSSNANRGEAYFTDPSFSNGAPSDALVIHSNGANGIKIIPEFSFFEIAGAQAVNTLSWFRIFNTGNVAINSLTDNGHKLQVVGSVTIEKDSLPIITSFGSNYLLTVDTITKQVGRISSASVGATIYSGDGTLAGNRTVTGSNNNLTFASVGTFQVNADSYIFEKKNATFPYTAIIVGADNHFEIGYTPTSGGGFTKGAGLTIDTNNNASLGTTQMPSTAPLYSTGGITYVSGLENQAGTFNPVATMVAGTSSVGITYHFVQCDASSGNVILNLPAASTAFAGIIGIKYIFFRTDNTGNTVTINRAGSDTINGATSFTLTAQYQTKQIQCVSTSSWAQY